MNPLALNALWMAALVALVCEVIWAMLGRARSKRMQTSGPITGPPALPPVRTLPLPSRRAPRPALAVALILAAGGLWVLKMDGTDAGPGPWSFLMALAGALPLYWAGLATDARRPSGERHLLAALLGGLVLCFSEFRITYITVPGVGKFALGALAGGALTVFWVFLVVSLIEVAGLLPLLAGVFALGIGVLGSVEGFGFPSVAGALLSGLLAGGVIGRGVAGTVISGGRSLEKSEVLVLGYFCAVATLATFMKSVAIAGLVLPLSILAVVLVLIVMHGFEAAILLRAKPRN